MLIFKSATTTVSGFIHESTFMQQLDRRALSDALLLESVLSHQHTLATRRQVQMVRNEQMTISNWYSVISEASRKSIQMEQWSRTLPSILHFTSSQISICKGKIQLSAFISLIPHIIYVISIPIGLCPHESRIPERLRCGKTITTTFAQAVNGSSWSLEYNQCDPRRGFKHDNQPCLNSIVELKALDVSAIDSSTETIDIITFISTQILTRISILEFKVGILNPLNSIYIATFNFKIIPPTWLRSNLIQRRCIKPVI